MGRLRKDVARPRAGPWCDLAEFAVSTSQPDNLRLARIASGCFESPADGLSFTSSKRGLSGSVLSCSFDAHARTISIRLGRRTAVWANLTTVADPVLRKSAGIAASVCNIRFASRFTRLT